jgi:hypothetical protein
MISVLLPATLRVNDSNHLEVHENVRTIAELVEASANNWTTQSSTSPSMTRCC